MEGLFSLQMLLIPGSVIVKGDRNWSIVEVSPTAEHRCAVHPWKRRLNSASSDKDRGYERMQMRACV